jgi:hypothetical protein
MKSYAMERVSQLIIIIHIVESSKERRWEIYSSIFWAFTTREKFNNSHTASVLPPTMLVLVQRLVHLVLEVGEGLVDFAQVMGILDDGRGVKVELLLETFNARLDKVDNVHSHRSRVVRNSNKAGPGVSSHGRCCGEVVDLAAVIAVVVGGGRRSGSGLGGLGGDSLDRRRSTVLLDVATVFEPNHATAA